MRIIKNCLGIMAASIVSISFALGQETTTTQTGMPTLDDKLQQWSEEEFSFKGTISKQSSRQSPFRISMDDRTKYTVLFDAGYKARKKIEACLDITFDCKISGTSLMIFERNSAIMNIIDVSEVIQSEIDYKRINGYLRNCMQRQANDFKNNPVQAQLGLEITKIRPIKYQISNLESKPSDRALEIITETLDTCFKNRIKLPVGHYKLSFASQNRNFVLESLE